ncbi:hypothetical protein AYO21_11042 [Fonsecaea monophora]|uniref:Uncharacterized protein n=1 Tax=Fonsecaea monophora TaxID=254056 RepID=A0A177ET23_9EURO|nr:hypothetical protein AYO21_11042 [Fonsecaea monophora]KAH0833656.1 hypothetical protein FOPE_03507 [Fonsecaea pedrosoi]OAG34786.1 hypothetical protein AYO21_11042 [Fonsecaea monophora]
MAEKLNRYVDGLNRSTVPPVDTTAFSMAKAGSEARLFVSWKKGSGKHYTQQIDGLVAYRPEHYLLPRTFVRNVVEWGQTTGLAQVGAVLEAVLKGPVKGSHNTMEGPTEPGTRRSLRRRK